MTKLSKILIFIKANFIAVGVSAAILGGGAITGFNFFRAPSNFTPQVETPILPFTVFDCRKINPSGLRNKYRCYAANALATADISWCKKIPHNFCDLEPLGNQYQSCLFWVAYKYKEEEICSLISRDSGKCDPDPFRHRDECFYDLAALLDKKELCGKITDNEWNQMCHDLLNAMRKHPNNFPRPF